jgi:hypothetical protein
MNNITFDIIGDLYLDINDSFNWEDKQTSLYCIITGNISKHSVVVKNVLSHLNTLYKGVFYINGYLELDGFVSIPKKNNELQKICNSLSNVLFLNNYVVVVDNVALVAVNNWYNQENVIQLENINYDKLSLKYITNDKLYLNTTIKELNYHNTIDSIVIVTASIPTNFAMYNFNKVKFDVLEYLTESQLNRKIKYSIFGGIEYDMDLLRNNLNYVNNPKNKKNPYWAKRIDVS